MILINNDHQTLHFKEIKNRQKLATVPSILGGVTIPNQPRYKVVASTALASIWRRCNAKVGNGLLSSSLAEVFPRRTRRYAVFFFVFDGFWGHCCAILLYFVAALVGWLFVLLMVGFYYYVFVLLIGDCFNCFQML